MKKLFVCFILSLFISILFIENFFCDEFLYYSKPYKQKTCKLCLGLKCFVKTKKIPLNKTDIKNLNLLKGGNK